MPYIPKENREYLECGGTFPDTVGEMNYMISLLLKEYLQEHGESYTTLNGLIGVLECAKLELYRRIAAPYEDKKIQENGDVY